MAEKHTACVVIKKYLKAAVNSVKPSPLQKINFLSLPWNSPWQVFYSWVRHNT